MLNWDDYNQDDSNNMAAQTPAPAVVAAAVATEQARRSGCRASGSCSRL